MSIFDHISIRVDSTSGIHQETSRKEQSLHMLNFSYLLDKVCLFNTPKSITFTGENAIEWEHLPEAIHILNQKSIPSIIITDGIQDIFPTPSGIKVNFRRFLEEKESQKQIEKNISDWKNRKVSVQGLFAFTEEDTLETLEYVFKIAENLGIRLLCYPRYNTQKQELHYNNAQVMGEKIEEFLTYIQDKTSYKQYYFQYPVTPCLGNFVEKNKEHFSFSCKQCPLFKATFTADSKFVSFCSLSSEFLPIKEYISFIDLENDLVTTQKEQASKHIPLSKCPSCPYYQKLCQGGCIA